MGGGDFLVLKPNRLSPASSICSPRRKKNAFHLIRLTTDSTFASSPFLYTLSGGIGMFFNEQSISILLGPSIALRVCLREGECSTQKGASGRPAIAKVPPWQRVLNALMDRAGDSIKQHSRGPPFELLLLRVSCSCTLQTTKLVNRTSI